MDEVIQILEEIQPDPDYETCDTLIDDGFLDSFAILSIISELEDAFDIRKSTSGFGCWSFPMSIIWRPDHHISFLSCSRRP